MSNKCNPLICQTKPLHQEIIRGDRSRINKTGYSAIAGDRRSASPLLIWERGISVQTLNNAECMLQTTQTGIIPE
jgi:hypothetical protein